MFVQRNQQNPLITPKMVKPSQKNFKVEGAFNAGVVEFEGQILQLVRVAESVISSNATEVNVPLLAEYNGEYVIEVKVFSKDDPEYDFSDPRLIVLKKNPAKVFLTSLSHFRIARSDDGVNFEIDEVPCFFPDNRYELFGCEDPRITLIEGTYYINYSAVSDFGITTGLAKTQDFKTFEKLGLIFAPDNRDVCFFPEKINGFYWALHRPAPKHFGSPEIWIAKSPDLMHWGDHQRLLGCSTDGWDTLKIGGGAPMLKTPYGWLQVYHGVDANERYCLGAFLTDLNDPTKIIARSDKPLIEPTASYEIDGFFADVVFSCGALIKDECLHIYYGASDETMALAVINYDQLWHYLGLEL